MPLYVATWLNRHPQRQNDVCNGCPAPSNIGGMFFPTFSSSSPPISNPFIAREPIPALVIGFGFTLDRESFFFVGMLISYGAHWKKHG
jgi:hypothetical protein